MRLFLRFLLIYLVIRANLAARSHLVPDDSIEDFQVENVIKILQETFENNEKLRVNFLSVLVIDLTEYFDTNKIIKRLQDDAKVILHGVHNDIRAVKYDSPDYIITLHDTISQVRLKVFYLILKACKNVLKIS